MSEESSKQNGNKSSPRLWVLAAVVLAVPVSIYGINASGLIVRSSDTRLSTTQVAKVHLPADDAARQKLLQRGEQLQKQQCAGCHARDTAGDALAFNQIAKSVREKSTDPPGQLVFLFNHHSSAGGSPDAPLLNLTDEDRLALALWIIRTPQAEE